ncbi:MAG: 16S rRNA (cytosine(1402)-N(4))-methyltransferase RsmH [Gammaproteobacteria bacterium]|nr:16S rRNA (cytosine(1402)-N(4))-methyltransferase RsmH [Gammaproteobacteria bacterium]
MTDSSSSIGDHIPVMGGEVMDALRLSGSDCVVDATYGRGGHSREIMSRLSEQGRLIVIDRDVAAISAAQEEWGDDERVDIVHGPFSELSGILGARGLIGKVTALLFDFGVSSPQLDNGERGFSFMHDGPLDMRMDQSRGVSAADWIKRIEEEELVRVLKKYGEERFAKRIARGIKTALLQREITTTAVLAAIVSEAIPTKEPGKHPATRTFQAIRIAVNDELGEIELVLPQALEAVSPGGRIVMISFHSLEDRLVKRYFNEQSKGDPFPPDMPITNDMLKPKLKLISKRIKAGKQELDRNRRSRSAVMRVAEKEA